MKIGLSQVDSKDRQAVHLALLDVWDRLSAELGQFWATIRPTEPKSPVYHYTTAAGLHGILDDGAIFLTDAFYLNDKTELRYGRDLVSEIIISRTKSATGPLQKFLREQMGRFDPYGGVFQATHYVASFCERADLLSQWRTYGAGGAGFALGFPPDAFSYQETLDNLSPAPAALHRIEYDRDNQQRLITFCIDQCSRLIDEDLEATSDRHEYKVLSTGYYTLLTLLLASLLPEFKHPMFHEEREWRLMVSRLREEESGVKFRPAGKDLVPFILQPLKDPANGRLPLCEIVVSPANEPALQSRTVAKFLRGKGYPEGSVKIVEPQVPLQFR